MPGTMAANPTMPRYSGARSGTPSRCASWTTYQPSTNCCMYMPVLAAASPAQSSRKSRYASARKSCTLAIHPGVLQVRPGQHPMECLEVLHHRVEQVVLPGDVGQRGGHHVLQHQILDL